MTPRVDKTPQNKIIDTNEPEYKVDVVLTEDQADRTTRKLPGKRTEFESSIVTPEHLEKALNGPSAGSARSVENVSRKVRSLREVYECKDSKGKLKTDIENYLSPQEAEITISTWEELTNLLKLKIEAIILRDLPNGMEEIEREIISSNVLDFDEITSIFKVGYSYKDKNRECKSQNLIPILGHIHFSEELIDIIKTSIEYRKSQSDAIIVLKAELRKQRSEVKVIKPTPKLSEINRSKSPLFKYTPDVNHLKFITDAWILEQVIPTILSINSDYPLQPTILDFYQFQDIDNTIELQTLTPISIPTLPQRLIEGSIENKKQKTLLDNQAAFENSEERSQRADPKNYPYKGRLTTREKGAFDGALTCIKQGVELSYLQKCAVAKAGGEILPVQSKVWSVLELAQGANQKKN